MKVLLVISSNQDISYYTKVLSEITDRESIIICNSIIELDNFINNEVFKKQLEIDVILLQNKLPNESTRGVDFQRRIKFDFEHTFSNYDFNWRSVPVMILLEKDDNREAYLRTEQFEYDELIGFPNRLELYLPEIIRTIKLWRKKLIDELSNLGIEYKNGNLNYSKLESFKFSRPTNILSDNFRYFRRKLHYSWLNINYTQIEQSIDEFIKEIKRAERNSKKDEKRFHRFFEKNPLFIKRDLYKQFWHEPRLHYNGNNLNNVYIEPDYALQPTFTKFTDLSLLEIKLPTEKFIKKSNFHAGPFSKLMNHLFQVSDYKEYLESDLYSDEVRRVLGFDPRKFDYNVLIGRQKDKEEVQDILNIRMKQMNMNFIRLITYDELMEYQVRFMERMRILEIK